MEIPDEMRKIIEGIEIYSTLEKIQPNTIELHPRVKSLLQRERIEQHTPDWYLKRKLRITASDIGSVLGKNPYSSRNAVFKKKTGRAPTTYFTSAACTHGLNTEDEARKVYEAITGIEVVNEDIGLLVDQDFDFIGASPDGVAKYFPILLEIKCPYSRVIIPGEVPIQYYCQMQCQMQVCDINETHYIEYKKPHICERGMMAITVVKRDKDWWSEQLPALVTFWNDVEQFYHDIGKPIGSEIVDQEPPAKRRKKRILHMEKEETKDKYLACMFVGNFNKYNDKLVAPTPIRKDQKDAAEFLFVYDVNVDEEIPLNKNN